MSGRDKPTPPLASRINGLIAAFAPRVALRREMALTQRAALVKMGGHYEGAGRTSRGSDFRVNRSDSVEAIRADRARLSYIARDMARNNPRAVRARRQLINHVVGAGIVPSVHTESGRDTDKARIEALIKAHCLSPHWDVDNRLSMLAQQGVGFGAIVGDGEVLFRRRFRRSSDGHPLNFQVQLLETDYLNEQIDGKLANGNMAIQGIEFDRIGRRVAYHLYAEHPGGRYGAMPATKRVDASNIIHAFDVLRPGQQRGVSWFAPVVTLLHELQKYQDGQVKRQEVAAMFAAIMKTESPEDLTELAPGSVLQIGMDDEIDWTDPPSVEGYEPFMKVTERTIAAAMGLTYEQLTGDLRQTSYTSHRAGRMATDPNIKDWQNNLMIGQVCEGFTRWIKEGLQDVADIDPQSFNLRFTPPARPVVDPSKDAQADRAEIEAGLSSRREKLRERGKDPVKVEAEIVEEREAARAAGVGYSTDKYDPQGGQSGNQGE